MTEADVIKKMRAHLEGLFPKVCDNCHRRFGTLREYLQLTKPRGSAISYDAEFGNWLPLNPIGTVTYANCPCGHTLLLTSEGMPRQRLWALMMWARVEAQTRRQSPQELLNYLRDKISSQVLAEPPPQSPSNA